ncbi:hypothetical protein PHYSODRAFT_318789 [Phytophthora sojae]|uniref:Uncharacterized protein n=1 Tax=Phytophthora sojae (strain P6497) TaxID=1094619 RepID=G5A6L8_PHYSP|nr:hypothetical protein PHYSODRAFT_318789 [Phytophthora sojae]EGZ08973.1 hypothetical protein PHYSODRAFT_318789 [Phytophthora sojae]|eukprot:XP_009535606.1 hypothetical protein PHYSODRAFT_318789 [Phytophthora sojae]
MIFAVSFGTWPLDHFLPPPFLRDGRWSVTTTWSSGDTQPAVLIRSMDDLRATLQCIEETACIWYPCVVADVFPAVHDDSLSRMLNNTPQHLLHAMINLYSHVFTELFRSIRAEEPAQSLSKKGCDFKHAHVLVALPAIVASFVNEKYGELRGDHPDLRK